MYPNPTSNGFVKVALPLSKTNYTIKAYNMYGKLVLQKTVEGNALQTQLLITTAKGLYMLNVESSNIKYNTKVIVQ